MMTISSPKQRGADKLARIPVKVVQEADPIKKPEWIRVKVQHTKEKEVERLKAVMRQHHLVTVCEEASCPNLHECFSKGTATFMIMGDKCTRRCAFCDVGHGRPDPLDPKEPTSLAHMIREMGLRYVVITSVDRDDLKDGGAAHFAACIAAVRAAVPTITIEVLVPDFLGRQAKAIAALEVALPEVFNHNIETIPRLYKLARPGSNYQKSLDLLRDFKKRFPRTRTKSGLMLGLGETLDEVRSVMADLRAHGVDMLTLGQYLAPSRHHLPVSRYLTPEEFRLLGDEAKYQHGFSQVASGPLVRSSYHADLQAAGGQVC